MDIVCNATAAVPLKRFPQLQNALAPLNFSIPSSPSISSFHLRVSGRESLKSNCTFFQRSSTTIASSIPKGQRFVIMASSTQGSQKRALISVSDKLNLELLATGLHELGYSLVSTGGTAAAIEKMGLPVTRVEEVTGFPEMMEGRVKTLHPLVHGGILARRSEKSHLESAVKHNIGLIDVVVVNLYPFFKTVTSKPAAQSLSHADFEECVENIDIGGPAMIRAAAKNHSDVFVLVDPADYSPLLSLLKKEKEEEGESDRMKRFLAWKAFQHCSSYDASVSEWFWSQQEGGRVGEKREASFTPPPSLTLSLSLSSSLRYGENPHQKAAFYLDGSIGEKGRGGIATAVLHHGKEMSYNNYLDADAAWNCVSEFSQNTCVVVKHTNPCGVASAIGTDEQSLLEAYREAVRGDPVSAFGGIVAFNYTVDAALARELREFRSPTDGETRMFYEIVIAPRYTEEGLTILKGKSKTLRIVEARLNRERAEDSERERGSRRRMLRQVAGGWLLQEDDDITPYADTSSGEIIQFTPVTDKKPTEQEMEDVRFAWLCVKHVKSNAIAIAKDGQLLGMGSGQPNRVKSCEIALEKADGVLKAKARAGEDESEGEKEGEARRFRCEGAVVASDAFFPFAWGDAVEAACQAGVSVIVQPGGSVRDEDAINCCNKYNVAMLFTGVRHFRH